MYELCMYGQQLFITTLLQLEGTFGYDLLHARFKSYVGQFDGSKVITIWLRLMEVTAIATLHWHVRRIHIALCIYLAICLIINTRRKKSDGQKSDRKTVNVVFSMQLIQDNMLTMKDSDFQKLKIIPDFVKHHESWSSRSYHIVISLIWCDIFMILFKEQFQHGSI